MNQSLLDAIGAGHCAITEIVRICANWHIPIYTKLTGAGGGGCAFGFLPQALLANEEGERLRLTQHLENHGFSAQFASVGGEGVRLESELSSRSE